MGWTETARELAKDIVDVLKQVATLEVQVKSVKETVERVREDQRAFIEQTRQDTRDLQKDVDEIRRRLSRIEGTLDAVFQKSFKEALLQMAREHKDEHGSLEDFGSADRLLGDQSSDDEDH